MGGVAIDSSPFVFLERRQSTVKETLEAIRAAAGTDDLTVPAIVYTELLFGAYRADTPERAQKRLKYLQAIFQKLPVFPFTRRQAEMAARIRGEQTRLGTTLPFADALIAAAGLVLQRSILTGNIKDFERIPGLTVLRFPQ